MPSDKPAVPLPSSDAPTPRQVTHVTCGPTTGCGGSIPIAADTCPHCGRPSPYAMHRPAALPSSVSAGGREASAIQLIAELEQAAIDNENAIQWDCVAIADTRRATYAKLQEKRLALAARLSSAPAAREEDRDILDPKTERVVRHPNGHLMIERFAAYVPSEEEESRALASLAKALPYLTQHANHIDGEFDNALSEVRRMFAAFRAAGGSREGEPSGPLKPWRGRGRWFNDWLTAQALSGEGVVTFGITENGEVGVWLPRSHQPEALCDGSGDDVFSAIEDYIARASRSRGADQ